MNIPAEVTYRGVEKTDAIDSLVNSKIAKLEQFCDHISSCRVAIEKTHDHPSSGSPYRVRLDITVPPAHELAVDRSPDIGIQYEPLDAVIRHAFDAMQRQLKELNDRQQGEVKEHPQQAMVAVVSKLFPEQDYGFIKTLDTGREIYFHRNSVIHGDFERIEVGTGVQFSETLGEMGPQATTVRIVDTVSNK
ncbi:HPF/RaiA family ribosome-associated protein [Plectonema cf. radiosum LEGE 06105]|uniref:HPF/RaiA family ribosome-associated protein n=1 Tax=Plectonema cf. radiosum LEGE 06105 TaxID=945769 RepID=A0A8J7EXR7_9CYAN|nr:HPF/RaiA family ribosome-associated protein [Plectonema radiosum]MBE9212061.1 HPF/RaiA family ribosome-associated protein [Plectonema cf. radiosum LEGE 06105]